MAFPEDMLDQGEEVLADVRPHWWYLAGAAVSLAVAIIGSLAAVISGAPTWAGWLCVAVLVGVVLWSLVRYVRWSSRRLVVTTERIIDRVGFATRRVREIPLGAVTDVSYRQRLFQRLIGAGDLVIESAGRQSQEVFPDLPRPAVVHNEIFRQLGNLRTGQGTPAAASVSIPAQIEQLDRLRQRGIITDAEFESKKADLLGRL